jgi:hypothetical protein
MKGEEKELKIASGFSPSEAAIACTSKNCFSLYVLAPH